LSCNLTIFSARSHGSNVFNNPQNAPVPTVPDISGTNRPYPARKSRHPDSPDNYRAFPATASRRPENIGIALATAADMAIPQSVLFLQTGLTPNFPDASG